MNQGSVFFDEEFAFHDGVSGEKLFVVLGTVGRVSVVAKTTSQPAHRGITYGCQPEDRFYNFFLPKGCCYLKKHTWVCLDEFYELDSKECLKKRFDGTIKPLCNLDAVIIKAIQLCAAESHDISEIQLAILKTCTAA